MAPVSDRGFFRARFLRAMTLRPVARLEGWRPVATATGTSVVRLPYQCASAYVVALGSVNSGGRRPVSLVGVMVHVAFLYGVCVGSTAEIVDQMFCKVKRE